MANYFSKYKGRGGPAIDPGIIQMMGSIGDKYAVGIRSFGESIGKGLVARAENKKIENEQETLLNFYGNKDKKYDLVAHTQAAVNRDQEAVDAQTIADQYKQEYKDSTPNGETDFTEDVAKLDSEIDHWEERVSKWGNNVSRLKKQKEEYEDKLEDLIIQESDRGRDLSRSKRRDIGKKFEEKFPWVSRTTIPVNTFAQKRHFENKYLDLREKVKTSEATKDLSLAEQEVWIRQNFLDKEVSRWEPGTQPIPSDKTLFTWEEVEDYDYWEHVSPLHRPLAAKFERQGRYSIYNPLSGYLDDSGFSEGGKDIAKGLKERLETINETIPKQIHIAEEASAYLGKLENYKNMEVANPGSTRGYDRLIEQDDEKGRSGVRYIDSEKGGVVSERLTYFLNLEERRHVLEEDTGEPQPATNLSEQLPLFLQGRNQESLPKLLNFGKGPRTQITQEKFTSWQNAQKTATDLGNRPALDPSSYQRSLTDEERWQKAVEGKEKGMYRPGFLLKVAEMLQKTKIHPPNIVTIDGRRFLGSAPGSYYQPLDQPVTPSQLATFESQRLSGVGKRLTREDKVFDDFDAKKTKLETREIELRTKLNDEGSLSGAEQEELDRIPQRLRDNLNRYEGKLKTTARHFPLPEDVGIPITPRQRTY